MSCGELMKTEDVISALSEACKRGDSAGLRQYHQQTASHVKYVEWLEHRVAMLTEYIVEKIKAEQDDHK
jgi:hypothetical protein